jgi:DNA polymerase III delta prime subunit
VVADEVTRWISGLQDGTSSRALLISGPTGHGKTSLALASVKALGAAERDITEINCANLRTLEDARDITMTINFSPVGGKYRVLILDEVHQMVPNAIQAFLTPLEKLAPTTIVIACTTDPEKLAKAFRNRFYEIKIKPYSANQIVEILSNLPGLKLPPKTLALISGASGGNPRVAIGMAEKGLTEAQADQIVQGNLATEQFIEAMFARDHKILYLASKLVTNENRTDFFNRVIQAFDAAYQINLGISPPYKVPQFGRYKWDGIELGKVLAKLIQLQGAPLTELKIWLVSDFREMISETTPMPTPMPSGGRPAGLR